MGIGLRNEYFMEESSPLIDCSAIFNCNRLVLIISQGYLLAPGIPFKKIVISVNIS